MYRATTIQTSKKTDLFRPSYDYKKKFANFRKDVTPIRTSNSRLNSKSNKLAYLKNVLSIYVQLFSEAR